MKPKDTMTIHPLKALSEMYLQEKTLSESSLKSYRIVYKHFTIYLVKHAIQYATTADIIAYRADMRELGSSTYNIYIHISAIKGLYHYLKQNQKRLDLPIEYAYDVAAAIQNERIKRALRKPILTPEQARHMILHTQANRKYLWEYRDHAIVYIMITAGLKVHEVIHARKADYVMLDQCPILYIHNKDQKGQPDYVKLTKGTQQALDDYLNLRQDDNPYLFIAHKKPAQYGYLSRMFFMHMFRTLLKRCGLEDAGVTPHCLRHTAAALNLLRGGSVEVTKQLMRHVNIQSTLIYKDYLERLVDDSENQIEAFILKEDGLTAYEAFIDYLER